RTLFKSPIAFIVEEKLRHPVIGHEDVRISVAIIIVESHAEAFALHGSNTRLRAHVAKMPAALVVEQRAGCRGELVGLAVRVEGRAAQDISADVPIEISSDEQVEQTVVIVIEESG